MYVCLTVPVLELLPGAPTASKPLMILGSGTANDTETELPNKSRFHEQKIKPLFDIQIAREYIKF
jgi:hypothetical protein